MQTLIRNCTQTISLGAQPDVWKITVERKLKAAGGIIFPDFASVHGGKERVGRIFLVVETATTENMMVAMALGIPRVPSSWVLDCCREVSFGSLDLIFVSC